MTHKSVSLLKSAVRIVSCVVALLSPIGMGLVFLAIGFAAAEVLGIVEEIADKRPEP